MQEAIIDAKGVPPLLTLIRLGSVLGQVREVHAPTCTYMCIHIHTCTYMCQEHAARTVWHLAALLETQDELIRCGAVSK